MIFGVTDGHFEGLTNPCRIMDAIFERFFTSKIKESNTRQVHRTGGTHEQNTESSRGASPHGHSLVGFETPKARFCRSLSRSECDNRRFGILNG